MKILQLLNKRPPLVSLLLVLSCFVSTIPQFILGEAYSFLTGQYPDPQHLYLLTLPNFTHSPEMLIPHFIGNMLIILFFGSLFEIVVGSRRFALVALTTFFSSNIVLYLRGYGSGGSFHGISGTGFGFMLIFLYLLIILFEQKKLRSLLHPVFLFMTALFVFSVFIIPVLEVVVQGRGFFQNFGQTIHLLSYTVVVPYLLVWRKDIELGLSRLINATELKQHQLPISPGVILLVLLTLLNIYNTLSVAAFSFNQNSLFTYSLSPPKDTPVEQLPKEVSVTFSEAVLPETDTLVSWSINFEGSRPEYHVEWISETEMKIVFNRNFTSDETIKLGYTVERAAFRSLHFVERIELEYE